MIHKDYLQSKIAIPELFHKILPREKIAAIIDNASLDEAVCLVAPYGCGKTLAVMSWLKERNRKAVWLTLDKNDSSEPAFFACLSASIGRLNGWPGIADDILSNPEYIKSPYDFLLKTIQVAENNCNDKILILDNLHLINDAALLRRLKELISGLLKRWRIIVISRAELPPIFNDLMLRRHICLITLKELNFSLEETEEFFNINGCDVSGHDILPIHSNTEGWPASLNVVLTISRGGSVEYGDAAREYIKGFFETEIWEGLDKSTRDFLLKTSVLDRLTPAACNAVTNAGATTPILRRLFVNGLFISRADGSDSYRYHYVFKDFLRYKLGESGIDERDLYKKLGWRLFEREEFEQSFPYFFKARDLYGLSRVFRIINSAETGLERYLELTRCVTALNVEELRDYPLIVAKMALINYALGNIKEMQRLYDIFLEWIEAETLQISPEEYGECVWEAGWLSYLNPAVPILSNKHEEWFNHSERDAQLQALRHSRAAVYRFPSMLRGIRDYCPALSTLEEYIKQNKETGYSFIDNESSLWRLDIVRAEYAYELENFTTAEGLIRNVLAEVEKRQITNTYFICIALLVKIVRAVHNRNEIGTLTARLKKMILKNGHHFLLPRFHAFELRNQLADGLTGQSEEFEKENRDYADKPYFYLLYRHMTLVRALLSAKKYNEAVIILATLESLCYQYNRIMDLMEVNILKAVAEYGLGNEAGSVQCITKALDDGRKYGFIRIFSDDAKHLWPIFELFDESIKDDYVKRIIISCKKTLKRAGISLSSNDGVYSALTKTELKILKTLDAGLSYEEMALDNNIKVSTLKSHLHSIYSKLYVSNKTAAIMAAREMGLI